MKQKNHSLSIISNLLFILFLFVCARARVWHREAHILSLPPTIQPDGSPLTEHWHQMCGFRVDSETSWPGCASGSVNENGSALSAVRACARDVYCGSVACDGWLTLRGWGFSRVQLNSAVMQWLTGLPLRLVSFITLFFVIYQLTQVSSYILLIKYICGIITIQLILTNQQKGMTSVSKGIKTGLNNIYSCSVNMIYI